MTKILIVSDTHGDPTWLNHFDFCKYDYIFHAGDHLMSQSDINAITPHYVDGNNDWGGRRLCELEIGNYKFLIVHGDEYITSYSLKGRWTESLERLAQEYHANVLIFGHTHIPFIHKTEDLLVLNPGSMSHSRHNGKKCYLELEISDNNEINIQNFELDRK